MIASTPDTSRRLLIVDDEEIVLVGLRETLRGEGYQVTTATDALAALETLKSERFAVVITDQQMPWMTGLEFLAQVKEIQPEATRILITAVLSLETVVEAINQGEIYRFIIKPWLREELLATVRNAVQRYQLIARQAELQNATLSLNQKLTELYQDLEEQMARTADQNRQLVELNSALEQNLNHSVQLCLRLVEMFYPTLGAQARSVFEICRAMARSLRLSEEEKRAFEISAWLHDIGLVGVPRRIIRRWHQDADSLDEAERALIEQHPVWGEELVRFVHPLQTVGSIIRSHHERFDGTGYPDRLAGSSIPWLSRLLAVAIRYAESNLGHHQTLETIKLASGTAFDPDAVRIFLRVLPKAAVPRKQREILISDLRPGMVLAKGIYTADGLLLVPEVQPLSSACIDKVLNHHRIEPIAQSLTVYC